MINAWVLYYDKATNTHKFEDRNGSDLKSTTPQDWGLDEECSVILVLQNASFLQAWVKGSPKRTW